MEKNDLRPNVQRERERERETVGLPTKRQRGIIMIAKKYLKEKERRKEKKKERKKGRQKEK